jgi:hypothetical protein
MARFPNSAARLAARAAAATATDESWRHVARQAVERTVAADPPAERRHRCDPYECTYSTERVVCTTCGRTWTLVQTAHGLAYYITKQGRA